MSSIENPNNRKTNLPENAAEEALAVHPNNVRQPVRVERSATVEGSGWHRLDSRRLPLKINLPAYPGNPLQHCITLQDSKTAALKEGNQMDLIEELRNRGTYLTTNEVMSILGKRRNTLCQWVRTGKMDAIRTGNSYLFDPRTLAAWLAERKTTTIKLRRAA